MFTGIVRELGIVSRIERRAGLVRLSIQAPKTASLVQPMESVAVSGVCLSVVWMRGETVQFEVIPETLRLTTLAALKAGARVNLEPSLTITDRLGGQILLGHIDGTGTVTRRRQLGGEVVLEIRAPKALRDQLVPKGPVAVEGVSLTTGSAFGRSTFTVHLIPETLHRTTLAACAAGDRVNIELDYLSKLIWQFARARNGTTRVSNNHSAVTAPPRHQVTRRRSVARR